MLVKSKFQFHKGTIRTPHSDRKDNIQQTFQFHKGTIRTWLSAAEMMWVPTFQFHKGTIRTLIIDTVKVLEIISIP